ncbi:MAG: GatB/YqeY domain-containing protein [Gammaproteobacteria bacterium]
MSLKDALNTAMKTAMREKQKSRLTTIRMALAAIKQVEIDEQTTLDDAAISTLLTKLVKQRKDAAALYESGDRPELAEQERAEMAVLQEFLPTLMDKTEIEAIVKRVITETGAHSAKDMGKIMGVLKPQLSGKADLSEVSQCVKALLTL